MKIAIYGHYFNSDTKPFVEELLAALNQRNAEIYLEIGFEKLVKEHLNLEKSYPTFSSYSDLDDSFDLFFTVGGDGTMLRCITFIRDSNIPVIGVNIGRLGFLATVKKEVITEAVAALYKKDYQIRERSLLQVQTEPPQENLASFNLALNEVTVSRKDTASMITVDTYLDGEYLTSYWADGLITATPTGSTGYSLSCGGPVITPQAKSFVLTPIAPHNLNARPLVIPEDTKIDMDITGREDDFSLSLDSRIATIPKGTKIHIEKASFSIKMIHLNDQTFIKTLREKMLWGEDTRNQ
ncbi:NAD kinase [Urechidicola sp. KH5]